jgi:signal transduction histidine kinase
MFQGQSKWVAHVLQDAAIGALILFGVSRPIFSAEKWQPTDSVISVALVLAISLFFRRRFPVTVLVASIGLSVVLMLLGVSGPVIGLAPALSLFAASRALTTQRFLVAALITVGVLVGTFLSFYPFDLSDPAVFAFTALQIIAVATALAAKSRRENVELLELRAIQAEESKESEARSRVGAERLRIARDLHDLIGHQLAATSLHAELAERLVRKDPEAALDSLGAIKRSARQSLGELAQMLRVLRDDDNLETLASMDNVGSLIQGHREYGLEVEVQFEGELSGLEASTQLVLYRCLQEGLTNAGKYASPKRVSVHVHRSPAEVRMKLTNPFDRLLAKPLSAGYGLVGLRERVESVGGVVSVSQQNSLFSLAISIPLTRGF